MPLRLTVLLNADEEIGSPASEPFIRREAERASCALVLEPAGPGGAVKCARKGIAMYRIEAHGVAAHSGLDPDAGVNAITELAGRLLEVEALAAPDAGTTVNIGTITGGTGRWTGVTGEYELSWKYVVSADSGEIQGRSVDLHGRLRWPDARR